VLLLDGDAAARQTLRGAFAALRMPAAVLEAGRTDAARQLLNAGGADLLITETALPDGSGTELARWALERCPDCSIVFVTEDRSFETATRALRLHAEDYITKPAEPEQLKQSLQAVVTRRLSRQSMPANDIWRQENSGRLRQVFWDAVFRGGYAGEAARKLAELMAPELTRAVGAKYSLVVTRMTNMEQDRESFSPALLDYALANIHAELLCGTVDTRNVIVPRNDSSIVVVTVCDYDVPSEPERACNGLMKALNATFTGDATCCLCPPAALEDLHRTYWAALDAIRDNVEGYGTWFKQYSVRQERTGVETATDRRQLSLLLAENNSRGVLQTLRRQLEEAGVTGAGNARYLADVRQDVLQCIHLDLAENGLPASVISARDEAPGLFNRALRSGEDLLRWAEVAVAEEIRHKLLAHEPDTLQERVDSYIERHYREDIHRDRLAEILFLSPVYLGKVYKQASGKTIPERITECRLAHARRLLAATRLSVAQIAEETGFSGQGYFATVFKKTMGMTPKEYRDAVRRAEKEQK